MGINFNEIKQQTEENSELINYYNNKGANAKIDRSYLYSKDYSGCEKSAKSLQNYKKLD